MLRLLCPTSIVFSFVCVLIFPGELEAQQRQQIREIADYSLPIVAKTRKDAAGQPYVLYNPRICNQMGSDLCTYFRAHEIGHIRMNHFGRGTPTAQAEYEADCWAARHTPARSVQAAQRYFLSGQGGGGLHGTSYQRYQRVARCYSGR